MAYEQKNEFDWPKGWYAVPRGFNKWYRAVWCTGHRYQGYGSNQQRAETIALDYRHGPLIMDEYLVDLTPATPEQVAEGINQLEAYYQAEIDHHEEQIAELKKDRETWRLRADPDEWRLSAKSDDGDKVRCTTCGLPLDPNVVYADAQECNHCFAKARDVTPVTLDLEERQIRDSMLGCSGDEQ